ncbi:LPS assembly protein LptD, partial [Francisella tularensis]|uniref:LPS assembly protein LptD n=1 Tax=Francisella tularensis TaxID=263 RepID=UPI002381A7AD
INLVTKTLLDSQLGISYNNIYVYFGITLLDYVIVNPIINLANIPYDKLPEVKFNLTSAGYTPDYLTLSLNTLNTYFYKSPWPVNP